MAALEPLESGLGVCARMVSALPAASLFLYRYSGRQNYRRNVNQRECRDKRAVRRDLEK